MPWSTGQQQQEHVGEEIVLVVYLHVGWEACSQAVAQDGGLLAWLEWLHGDEGAKALKVVHVEARIDISSFLHRVGDV